MTSSPLMILRLAPTAWWSQCRFTERVCDDASTPEVSRTRKSPGKADAMAIRPPDGSLYDQTEDLVRCVGVIGGLSDLRLRCHRGPTFSLIGEQLTGEQLNIAPAKLPESYPILAKVNMTCPPSHPREPALTG
ncbi:MAG: hypothetical protein ACPGU1_00875 [Myxococcota bacterium]